MAEGVNGGPARSYRRRSLAEQREAYQIASAELAVLKAKEEQINADAEVRLNRLDLQILKIKQQGVNPTTLSPGAICDGVFRRSVLVGAP